MEKKKNVTFEVKKQQKGTYIPCIYMYVQYMYVAILSQRFSLPRCYRKAEKLLDATSLQEYLWVRCIYFSLQGIQKALVMGSHRNWISYLCHQINSPDQHKQIISMVRICFGMQACGDLMIGQYGRSLPAVWGEGDSFSSCFIIA